MSPYYDADDDYSRGRDARRPGGRDRSPDYYSGGAPPVVSGAMPAQSRARLQYEPHTPLYPPDTSAPNVSSNSLQVPSSRHRPRSLPPPSSDSLVPRRRRSDSRSSSIDDEDQPHSPLDKARHAVRDTFTQSTAGIGVGVLGAIVGGLAARELSEKARHNQNDHHHHHNNNSNRSQDHQASRLISTLVGAAVGGLGANALERRLEASREKDKGEQKEWERKWGRDDGRDRDDYDDRAPRRQRDRSRGPPAGYADDDYDYVYDEPPRRPRSRHGDERYQSR